MSDQSFSVTYTVERPPHAVYQAINDVRGWWEETAAGRFHEVGDEFTHWVAGVHYARIRVAELLPGKRVVWQVLDNWMSFITDQSEWKGTTIRFDLTPVDGGTELRFTHVGLTPKDECYDVCNDAWTVYVTDSLRSLIETGVGKPSLNPDEQQDPRFVGIREALATGKIPTIVG